MAAYPRTDERYPPIYFKRFVAGDFPVTLHSTGAPAKAQHLPALLVFEATAAQTVTLVDSAGVSSTMVFPATGTVQLRAAPVSISAGTVTAVTVFWSQAG